MGMTTLSSREFNQNAGSAKRAAERGPVFITDRGRRAHVLLTIADYQRLSSAGPTIVDLIGSNAAAAAIDLELPPRLLDERDWVSDLS